MFQFLEAGGPAGLFYSPGRDLGHCGLPYIGYALSELLSQLEAQDAPVYKLMDLLGVNKEELEEGINLFIKSLEEEVKSGKPEPLETNAFTPVREQVRVIIFFYIAPVFIGTSLRGYKDVHTDKVVKELDEETFRKKALKYISSFGRNHAVS